ncbi:hypothetical protein H632_c2374p0, partial [Helicosporidium sp. ATCC 50920]
MTESLVWPRASGLAPRLTWPVTRSRARPLACPIVISTTVHPSIALFNPQISRSLGPSHDAGACSELHEAHAAYLGLPSEMRSEEVFSALVQRLQGGPTSLQAEGSREVSGSPSRWTRVGPAS